MRAKEGAGLRMHEAIIERGAGDRDVIAAALCPCHQLSIIDVSIAQAVQVGIVDDEGRPLRRLIPLPSTVDFPEQVHERKQGQE